MHQVGTRKIPECRSVIVNEFSHEFGIGDRSHHESEDIYAMLNLVNRLRAMGFVWDTSEVLLNIDEEERKSCFLSTVRRRQDQVMRFSP